MNIFVTMHNIQACVVSGITKKKKEERMKTNKTKTRPPPPLSPTQNAPLSNILHLN